MHELGYGEDDISTQWDENEGWIWGSLVGKMQPLTEKEWDAIRPQLEETIRLRRQKRERERTRNACAAAAGLLAGLNGRNLLFTRAELIALPVVDEYIKATDMGRYGHYLHNEAKQRILKGAREAGTTIMRAVKEKSNSDMLQAMGQCGFALPGHEARASPRYQHWVLDHCCSFFSYEGAGGSGPFSKAIAYLQANCVKSLNNASMDVMPVSGFNPDIQAIKIAKRLSELLKIDKLSMDQLLNSGDVFSCRRCQHQQCRTWDEIVSHRLTDEVQGTYPHHSLSRRLNISKTAETATTVKLVALKMILWVYPLLLRID